MTPLRTPWRFGTGALARVLGVALGTACADAAPPRERDSAPPVQERGGAERADAGSGATFGNAPPALQQGAASGVRDASLAPDAAAACASASTPAELVAVHLALAFDVSGSMGKGDKPWHDRSLKWDPVVSATRGLLETDESAGLLASLTFFPAGGDEDERCVEEAYAAPDVPMTELPSPAFGAAIEAVTPQSDDDWRGGTPTAWVLRGTRGFVEAYRAEHPGRFAIVLITDGYPQGCDDADDSIDTVAAEVADALAADISTYVVGVANPPIEDAPDTVSDLNDIALAGGTAQAFLIDTGDPQATSEAFTAAVQQIRERTHSCAIAIPTPPAGQTFDKERIAVRQRLGGAEAVDLEYDAACSEGIGWHYDDPAAPAQITLCDASCAELRGAPEASLDVLFACERLFSVD